MKNNKINNVKSIFFENRSIKQTILKNTFWLGAAEVIQRSVAFLATIWLARHFGPAGYGRWAFALSFVALFAVLADFGFGTLTVREIARDKSKTAQYIDNIIVIKLILGLITLGIIALAIQFLDKEPEVVKLVYFLGIYIVLNTFTTFFQSIFRANEKMQYETVCRVIESLSLLCLVSFFILSKGSILTLSYAYLGTAIISIVISLGVVWRYFSRFFLEIDWQVCKAILKDAWPFGLTMIFGVIYHQIDTVMLSIMKGDVAVGWYNAAQRLPLMLLIFPTILNGVVFPKMSYFYKFSKIQLRDICLKYFKYMSITGIFVGLVTLFFAGKIINFVFGSEYLQSALALQIIIWSSVLILINSAFFRLLEASDKQITVTKITGCGGVLNIILNYLLIPKYSYIGASIATVASELLITIIVAFIASKNFYKI